jgi:hypothetical protein
MYHGNTTAYEIYQTFHTQNKWQHFTCTKGEKPGPKQLLATPYLHIWQTAWLPALLVATFFLHIGQKACLHEKIVATLHLHNVQICQTAQLPNN